MPKPPFKLKERRAEEHRCSYCTDEVSRDDARTCPGCGLRLHSDCLLEVGPLCASVGCGVTTGRYEGKRPRAAPYFGPRKVSASDEGHFKRSWRSLLPEGQDPRTWLQVAALTAVTGAALGLAFVHFVRRDAPGLGGHIKGALVGGLAIPSVLVAIAIWCWIERALNWEWIGAVFLAAFVGCFVCFLVWFLSGSGLGGLVAGGVAICVLIKGE